jgi:lipopolysaccharide/colanic/teichoic acid biosynthesis glycosyltransferase/glycosyltransferase involved in cell wall biosynthesis
VYSRLVKRFLDILAAIVALPFFLLALVILAPLIFFEDRGPIFYLAPRMGWGGNAFKMYKFRSMKKNAPDLRCEDGSTYNAADDPRQTRIGRFMRKSSLDELPQILNILKGEMSFIGPRPDDLQEATLYVDDESRKQEQRPGVSGYAQVYGRNAIQFKQRLALDLYYVDHISFLLDAKIFLRTFTVVFSRKGVYVEAEIDALADTPDTLPDYDRINLISIAVVACNEEEFLPRLFHDISRQDFPQSAMEILLIDSSSDDSTRKLMVDFASTHAGFSRIQVLDNPGRYLPSGCNIALGAYRGDALVRIDAHARIPDDFVRRCVEVLEEGHAVVGGPRPVILDQPTAFGEVLLASEESAFGASIAAYRRSDKKDKKGTVLFCLQEEGHGFSNDGIQDKKEPSPFCPGREVDSLFHGAYRRRVYDVVGIYDERLQRTEDNDMSQRILAKNIKFWMDERIHSEQYLRPSYKALIHQKASNAYWIGLTLWLKPKAVKSIYLVPLAFLLALVASIVLGIILSWWPLIVLAGVYGLFAAAMSIFAFTQSGKKSTWFLLLPLIFLSIHLSYGAGTLWGLISGLWTPRE